MRGHQERLGFRSVDPVGVGRFRYEKYLGFLLFAAEIIVGGREGAAVERAAAVTAAVGG